MLSIKVASNKWVHVSSFTCKFAIAVKMYSNFLLRKNYTSTVVQVALTLCGICIFSEKFTLCYFLPFPHFVLTFYAIFLKIFYKNPDSKHLDNNLVVYNWFLRSIKTKSRFPTMVHKKIQICFTLCEFHIVRVSKKNLNSTK